MNSLTKNKKVILGIGLLLAVVQTAQGAPFWLVTPEEYAKELSSDIETKSLSFDSQEALAPKIVLLKPRLSKKGIGSPITIELEFQPQSDAKIVPSSLKVLYGVFRIDITDRLLENKAAVTEKGVFVEDAKLPSGEHKVIVEIKDDQDREGRASYSIKVRS